VPTLIALIRGINVGKAKRVAMADLRKLVEKLGYTDVRTLLNSGNVVFKSSSSDTAKAGARIEKALIDGTGVSARVLVVTAADLAAAVKENPLLKFADNPSRLLVAFLANPADLAGLQPLLKQDWGKERLALGSRVAYFWLPDGVIDSKIFAALSRKPSGDVTTRNWATVLKIHAITGATVPPPTSRTRGG
jgi:uncharacterized protein (DUF1697 family)